MLRKIKLYGKLAKFIGHRVLEADVAIVQEHRNLERRLLAPSVFYRYPATTLHTSFGARKET